MTTLLDHRLTVAAADPPRPAQTAGRARRWLRGRPDDPAWVRPALLALLASTAVLYIWDLGASGWANSFYAAAVEAGTKSWKAFFFGSFDSSNFITVDKPPASLWVMELSARIFGLNSWSLLVPQALEGVATVWVLYATVRRWFRAEAALLAGAVVAVTPVAALMFRYDNPDSLLVLLLTGAAWATVRVVEDGRARFAALAGALVGLAFITKELQALLVLPAMALAFLVAGRGPLGRRLVGLLTAGCALVVSAGWWVLAVTLTPAADRPYIGGSQNNTLWNVIFGYNGFGRLTGNEAGSVTGGGAVPGGAGGGASSPWGVTGLTRLFGADMGTQISWLLPAALVLLAAGLAIAWRRPRHDRLRAAMILWGGILVVTGLAFSLGRGIIHPYYTVALAPAIGALVGIGATELWARRDAVAGRAVLAVVVGLSAVWGFVLLDRTPQWFPALRFAVLAVGLAAAAAVAAVGRLRPGLRRLAVGAALAASLGGSTAFALDTAATAHTGAIPTAGPTAGGAGGPGGTPGAGFPGGGGPGALAPGSTSGRPPNGAAGGPPAFGGGQGGTGAPPAGAGLPGATTNPGPGRRATGPGGGLQSGFRGGPGGSGGVGGLLGAGTPSAAAVRTLEHGASAYRWVLAVTGANDAAGYQLATDLPVMAIGGFNGTDPAPTLAEFESMVARHEVHYYVAGGGAGPGAGGSSSSDATRIQRWVESHFTSVTVGNVTLYDLTSPR